MGNKGMFLTHWNLAIDPKMEIKVVLVWVRLVNLPMIL